LLRSIPESWRSGGPLRIDVVNAISLHTAPPDKGCSPISHLSPFARRPSVAARRAAKERLLQFSWNISRLIPVYRASVLVAKSPSLCRGGNNQ
jgi:hypothetical protein